MPAIQTTYDQRMRPGRAGLVVNMETQNSITRTYEGVEPLPFGVPVFQGVADKGVVQSGQEVLSAAAAAAAPNTGNGTITASPPLGAGATEGVYTLTAVADAGVPGGLKFDMKKGNGPVLGSAVPGIQTTIAGIGPFAIASGGTAFVAGDDFTITVEAEAPANAAFRGYVIEDKTLIRLEGGPVDHFRKGESLAPLTAGVIWAIAGGAVEAGEPVHYDPATKRHVAAGGVTIPNAVYDTSATTAGDLVQVRVSHL